MYTHTNGHVHAYNMYGKISSTTSFEKLMGSSQITSDAREKMSARLEV